MITIGIGPNWDPKTLRLGIPADYMNAVIRAGALPLLFPASGDEALCRAMVDQVDGMIFPGGEDIHPREFGEQVHPKCGTIIPERDQQELRLFRYLLSQGKPYLAICRGIQLVNVAFGGSLYQDLASQYDSPMNHASFDVSAGIIHQVKVSPGSLLASIVAEERLPVNSRHHQAIKALAPGLKVNAVSEDGLVEGVEHADGYPGLAFQWHPENLAAENPDMQALFNWLVEQAGKHH